MPKKCKNCEQKPKASLLTFLRQGIKGVIKAKLGLDKAPQILIDQRLKICTTCTQSTPCLKNRQTPCRCKECGCWLDYKTKIKSESCPLQLWPNPQPADTSPKKIT